MTNYQKILPALEALIENEEYEITLLANSSALLKQFLEDTNWVGYYLNIDNQLVLGPFQGLPACEIIPFDRGVCGSCATQLKTVLVEDVHKFPGHIACDSASNSEIVVPIIINGQLYGLLDIDSPSTGRFTSADQEGLEEAVKLITQKLEQLLAAKE